MAKKPSKSHLTISHCISANTVNEKALEFTCIENCVSSNLTCVCRSEERSRALELCSWGFENEALLGSFLAQLEAAGSHTRAAATAVFNQRIKQAVQILQRGASSNKMPALNATAMALAGSL